MGIFSSTLRRTAIGGLVGGGVSAFGSGYDQEATTGGFLAGAAAGAIGGGLASKMFSRPNNALVSGMRRAGGGIARAGAGLRSRGRDVGMFGSLMTATGTGIGNVGLGLRHASVGINKTGNTAMLALGTGAAGYIGGSIMESNRGTRRISRRRAAMYGY